MTETIPESCELCPKFVYKGDDELHCQAARMREYTLLKWQKRPKWCPIARRVKRNEGNA